MYRTSFAAALFALGTVMGGCATDSERHADMRTEGGTHYDANTDTHLDRNIYIDSRNVQEASAPESNSGFKQGQYWSEEPEPNRDVYGIPRDDVRDHRDSNNLGDRSDLRDSNDPVRSDRIDDLDDDLE